MTQFGIKPTIAIPSACQIKCHGRGTADFTKHNNPQDLRRAPAMDAAKHDHPQIPAVPLR